MSDFRDVISPNDFKGAVFAGNDFCETVTYRKYPVSAARATGTLTGSTVTGITIDSGGSGYLSTPTYSVGGTGTSLVLDSVTVSAGVITAATILSSSADWTAPAVIEFTNGYEEEEVQAVVVREGVSKVNGKLNISDSLRVSVSKLDIPEIDTGRDRFVIKRKLDQPAQEMRIVNIITQNSALWILAVK